jgi:hypothetical protein
MGKACSVVVVDEILGVIHAGQALPLDAEVFRALRADGEDERVEARAAEIVEGEVARLAHRHVSEIGHARVREDLLELAAEAALHLVLVEEDAVLGEPARLDVAVQEQHAASGGGERAGGEEAGWACTDHRHDVNRLVSHEASLSRAMPRECDTISWRRLDRFRRIGVTVTPGVNLIAMGGQCR